VVGAVPVHLLAGGAVFGGRWKEGDERMERVGGGFRSDEACFSRSLIPSPSPHRADASSFILE